MDLGIPKFYISIMGWDRGWCTHI